MAVLVGQYGDEIQLSAGNVPMPNTAITVLTMAGGAATLYTSLAGTTTAANPVNTDGFGNLLFYAAPGQYQLRVGSTPSVYATVIVDLPGAALGVPGGPAGPLDSSGLLPAAQTRPVVAGLNVFNVTAPPYNATGNGSTDDTTAITNANSDAHTSGGIVYFPPPSVAYKTSATFTISKPTVHWQGLNSAAVTLKPTNNGDCIRVQMASFVADMQAGAITGLTIDGTGAGASACGIHYGDAMNGLLDDLHVVNFTGASAQGIHMDNVTNYTEGLEWGRVLLSNNTTDILFDVNGGGSTTGISNSFGYHRMLRVRHTCNAGQTGLWLRNGALVYNGLICMAGNYASGSTAIRVDGITGGGITALAKCLFSIQGECASGTATSIMLSQFGSITGHGVLDFSSGTFTGTMGSPNPGSLDVSGWVQPGSGLVGTLKTSGTLTTSATAGGIAIPTAAAFVSVVLNGTTYKIPLCLP